MALLRLALAALALLIFPATASADLRSPVLGEAQTLSLTPDSRTYEPAIATDGSTTYVAYSEQRTGVMFQRVAAAGTELGAMRALQSHGSVSRSTPAVAVSGERVYVAWIESSLALPEAHAVVATSRDGGRSFGAPVVAGRPTGHGAWDLELAADRDTVFVAWVDDRHRVWTAGSRDGGVTFPCQATVTPPGDAVNGGGTYDLAVDGPRVHWTWTGDDRDVYARRSTDRGLTLEPVIRVHDTPAAGNPGTPTIAARGGIVAIAYSELFRMERPNGSGTDFGYEPIVFNSQDGGDSWAETPIGDAANRCIGDYCAAPYGLAVNGIDVYVGWRGQGSMWLARSTDGGANFPSTSNLGPYAYTWNTQQMPYVAAHGDTVVATWHSAPNPGSFDMDPLAAFSSDRGETFTLRTVDDRAGQDMLPVAAAWAPDPQGAGFAWLSFDRSWATGDSHVRFVPLSASEPDVAVLEVVPAQAARDAARLAAGRPTTVRVKLRSAAPARARVPLVIDVAYDEDGERVERTFERDLVLRPGVNTIHLLSDEPITVGAGRITASVRVAPGLSDHDPSNDFGEGSRAVVETRPLTLLFVPVAANDEAPPACNDVRAVAEGAEEHIAASWPVDPYQTSVLTSCTVLRHAPGLDDAGLMGQLTRLDRLKHSGLLIDKVVGVVPRGWFSRQAVEGLRQAVGAAPLGGALDAALVERQNTGGWVVAHELAHQLGSHHRVSEPAPGYWTAERRDIPETTLDFMHFSTAGASVGDTTGRWLSKQTWDFLTSALSDGPAPEPGTVLSLTGSVGPDGAVALGEAVEVPGAADAPGGPFTAELLDAGGQVVETARFDAANDLGPIGGDAATGAEHAETSVAGFSLQLPANAAARTLRVKRGGDVVATRARSAHAPVLQVATPARVEVGDDLKLTWTASDADGDALTHTVALSTDGGATWIPLGDALSSTELTVKAVVQIAGADVRVRVTTTDGWNTVTAESGSFAVGGELSDGLVIATDWWGGVWTVGLDGSGAKQILDSNTSAWQPKWSPDGRRLAWRDNGIWVADGDGTGKRRITPEAQYLDPVWTPDGDTILADKWRLGTHDYNVAIDVATGAETPFADQHRTLCGFTRDGSKLVASSQMWGDAIALLTPDGTAATELGNQIVGYDCLSLSPDNRYGVVAHNTYDPNRWTEIFVYDLQTKERRNLTNRQFSRENGFPVWSPTGEWIVFSSGREREGSNYDLWKIRPDGTGAQKILDGAPMYTSGTTLRYPDIQPRRGVAPDPEPTRSQLRPAADAGGAYTAVEGEQVTLDARGSAPGAGGAAIVGYGWDLDGDGAYADATGETVSTSFPDEGTYTVGVQVVDADGGVSTATAEVVVTNAAPVIADARVGDGEPANFSARIADPGTQDSLEAKLYWDGSDVAETVPVIPSGDGYVVLANRPGRVATVKLVVTDGDGGRAEAVSTRVLVPVNGAPTAEDARAEVVAGETVDIDLPARDPEGERLEYEIVGAPARGELQMRAPSAAPEAPDVTYLAGEEPGADTFTYRVSAGAGRSRVATVTVDVRPRPDAPPAPGPKPLPTEPEQAPAPRPGRTGTKPVDPKVVEQATEELRAAPSVATYVALPATKRCASRRNFSIRIKRGDYRKITVHVNGKPVKVRRNSARVDLRGLPKGRFKVKVAVTLHDGKVVRSTRQYRTCAPKTKKGGRA